LHDVYTVLFALLEADVSQLISPLSDDVCYFF